MSEEKRDNGQQPVELPQEFIDMAGASIGMEALSIYLEHFNNTLNKTDEGNPQSGGNTITSIRINPAKTQNQHIRERFGHLLQNAERVPWCSNGYYLPQRPQFTLDPLLHCGAYYVQEASSMYMEKAFEAISSNEPQFFNKNIKVLDLCAAPGGKSTHIASLLNSNSLLVSNEVIKSRAVILADNMSKWGAENVVVTNNDPRDFKTLKEHFNLIVVDAPCSGEGMFIKDPAAIGEWSTANVELCASRQKRILQDIWGSLQEGGFLIYSTCTFNHFENDDNLLYIINELGAQVIEVDFTAISDKDSTAQTYSRQIIKTSAGGYQFVPGLVKGEGQYMAVVKKIDGEQDSQKKEDKEQKGRYVGNWKGNKKAQKGKEQQNNNGLKGFTYMDAQNYHFSLLGEMVKAYPKELANDIKYIESSLRVISSGIAAATVKGRDFIPHADLALCVCYSIFINQAIAKEFADEGTIEFKVPFTVVELELEQALAFLSKDQLTFENQPNGYLLLTYKGVPLGFVKNLGNRSNNLWPQARRIRMAH